MKPAFDYFEHDADVGVVGRGTSVEESFIGVARAMFAIQCAPDSVRGAERVELEFEEDDVELALVQWLNALLAAARERSMVFRDFGLARSGVCWRGWARGEPWPTGLDRGPEVKGATASR